jgi:hypothetical protein
MNAATPRAWGGILRAVGLVLCVVPAALLALITYDPFPGWGTDPAILPSPIVGIGPSGLAQAGTLMLLGAVLCFMGMWAGGGAIRVSVLLLTALGGLGASLHAIPRGSMVEDVAIGAAWIGGVAGAAAVFHAAADPRLRRLFLAGLAGVVVALVVKAVVQVFVEHPQTVAQYRATREAFLASQGWEAGSGMAAAFERRLMQPEAGAWFGLANVYSTFAAWGVVFAAGLGMRAWADRRHGINPATLAVIAGAFLVALMGLVLGGAKGGYAAAGAGLAVIALAAWAHAAGRTCKPSLVLLVGVGAIVAPILAVVARGLAGERIPELSLLFRWYYLQGAARVIAEHPLIGVGPAGFKDAYILAKPPLSPEEVTSPHCVVVDWVSCLGVSGLAWGALLLILAVHAARNALGPRGVAAHPPADPRVESGLRIALLAGWFLVLLVAVRQESGGVGPEALSARVLGAAAGIGIGLLLLRTLRQNPSWAWAGAPAALAVIAHAQVELTGSYPTSAPLLLIAVALGASYPGVRTQGAMAAEHPATASQDAVTHARSRRRAVSCGILVAMIAGVVMLLQMRVIDLARWQAEVQAAAVRVAVPTDLLRRLSEMDRAGSEAVEGVVREARALDPAAPTDPRRLAGWLQDLRVRRLGDARARLERAIDSGPPHFETFRAASRLAVLESQAAADPDRSRSLRSEALRIARKATELFPRSAQCWTWLATIQELIPDPQGAIVSLERAAELDPHGLTTKVRLADAHVRFGDPKSGSIWARRALESDRNLRLDPLRRLSDRERARMEELAGRT